MHRHLLKALLAPLLCSAMLLPAAAADFPTKNVRILVGFAPGGTTDLLARIMADELRNIWKANVLVDNRPGADGIVATTAAHNDPDGGHTLLMSTNALVITPHMRSLPYVPLRDFEPITIVGQEYHHMLVTPSLPAKTPKEFVALANSKPEGLTFSSAGPGSAPFLGMQRFIQTAGIKNMVHVPYPGSNPAVLAVIQGSAQAMFSSPSTTLPVTLEGKVRGLAVAGPKRDPNAPDIPTFAESGFPGFESTTWFALVVSSKVPPDVLKKIRTDVAKAMANPTVLKRIRDIKSVPIGNTAEEFRAVMKADLAAFGKALEGVKK